jgi:Flp pilus assembly protein TadG
MMRVDVRATLLLRRARRIGRALGRDTRATAAVETALILPVALTMLALVIFGAEAFDAQRKVTLTARTATDLITQEMPQYPSGKPSIAQSNVVNDLSFAAFVIRPFDPSNLSMVASEVQINSDETHATVIWSQAYNGATARTVSSSFTLPIGLGTGQKNNYFVLGEVYYAFTPFSLFTQLAALTLHDSIYLTPRASPSLNLLVGQ